MKRSTICWYATDYFQKNRKDVTGKQEKQVTDYTLTSSPLGRPRQGGKMLSLYELTIKRPMKYLELYKISEKVIKIIPKAMKNSKVKLTSWEKTLAKVKIQTSIFQGDALLRLLCVIAMMPLNYIGSKYKQTKSIKRLITKFTWTISSSL